MHLHDFHVFKNDYPLVASGASGAGDELVIVHRDAVSIAPAVFIGCHREATVEVRSAVDLTAIETAAAWTTLTLQAGSKTRIDLPGTGNPLHVVTKIKAVTGQIFVSIVSFGEFRSYFKQTNMPY